jgi:fucose 4-O-acetylase-like acetyltransferase
MGEKKRVEWIDGLRGFCMLVILWYHSDFYYTRHPVISYDLYVTNVLAAFFFISGFLFPCQEHLDLSKKLRRIVTSLLIPYFIFTSIIAIPKSLINGNGELLQPYIGILLGRASWFVTTLIVCEVIFAFLVKKGLTWLCLLLLPLGIVLQHIIDYPDYWNVRRALLNIIFLYAGFMCKQKGLLFVDKWPLTILSLLLVVLLKYAYVINPVAALSDKSSLLHLCCYYVDMFVGILFLVSVASRLFCNRCFRFVGRNSLYYYFFCGACPTFAAIITNKVISPYDGFYLMVAVAFAIAVVLDTLVVIAINKIKASCSARP